MNAARARGSACGVRSPERYGRNSTPSAPGLTSSASARSSSYATSGARCSPGVAYDDFSRRPRRQAGCRRGAAPPLSLRRADAARGSPRARGRVHRPWARARPPALARTVLEGVAYGLRDSLELLRQLGVRPESGRVSGGGPAAGSGCKSSPQPLESRWSSRPPRKEPRSARPCSARLLRVRSRTSTRQ